MYKSILVSGLLLLVIALVVYPPVMVYCQPCNGRGIRAASMSLQESDLVINVQIDSIQRTFPW